MDSKLAGYMNEIQQASAFLSSDETGCDFCVCANSNWAKFVALGEMERGLFVP